MTLCYGDQVHFPMASSTIQVSYVNCCHWVVLASYSMYIPSFYTFTSPSMVMLVLHGNSVADITSCSISCMLPQGLPPQRHQGGTHIYRQVQALKMVAVTVSWMCELQDKFTQSIRHGSCSQGFSTCTSSSMSWIPLQSRIRARYKPVIVIIVTSS